MAQAIANSSATAFFGETGSELKTFARNRPGLLAGLLALMIVLPSFDYLELIPHAKPLTDSLLFRYLHDMHYILLLGFVLFSAYHWFAGLGWALLTGAYTLHLPYVFMTYPEHGVEHLTLLLTLFVAMRCIQLVGKLQETLRAAESSARSSSYSARHDHLTGLPNRVLFREQAQLAMSSTWRGAGDIALIYFDLDGFKDVNDSLGHGVGDEVLTTVAARLQKTLREGETAARLGGDEFVVIAKNLESMDSAAFLTERLMKRISEPIVLDGHEIVVTGCAGIAPYPIDGDEIVDPMQLLVCADMAMYRAKAGGAGGFEFYDHLMSEQITNKIKLQNDLRHAIERDQLVLHYQPIVDIHSGTIVGVEALVRWNHPEKGLLAPADFIPASETNGLVVPIGGWVLETACAQNRAWQDAGLPPIKMAVNLSAVQLRRHSIVEIVASALEGAGLDPKYLDLELTESVLIQDINSATKALSKIHALGVGLSIDDFGTGYSSLSCLKQFAVDTLKIDRVFVHDIHKGNDSAAIAKAVVRLGHSLGIQVLAEGVETEAELKYLQALNCNLVQGNYFSPPVLGADLARRLREKTEATTGVSSEMPVEFYKKKEHEKGWITS